MRGAANRGAAVNREKRMMSARQPRPEMFSPGWEARCEYLINSHQTRRDLPSDVAGARHPKASAAFQTRAVEHEQEQSKRLDGNREDGLQRY